MPDASKEDGPEFIGPDEQLSLVALHLASTMVQGLANMMIGINRWLGVWTDQEGQLIMWDAIMESICSRQGPREPASPHPVARHQ